MYNWNCYHDFHPLVCKLRPFSNYLRSFFTKLVGSKRYLRLTLTSNFDVKMRAIFRFDIFSLTHSLSLSPPLSWSYMTYEYYIYYYSWPRAFVSNFGPAMTVTPTPMATSGFQKGCKTACTPAKLRGRKKLRFSFSREVRGAGSHYKV